MKAKEIKFLRENLFKYPTEKIIDVWSALGIYLGSFLTPTKDWRVIKKINKDTYHITFKERT